MVRRASFAKRSVWSMRTTNFCLKYDIVYRVFPGSRDEAIDITLCVFSFGEALHESQPTFKWIHGRKETWVKTAGNRLALIETALL